MLGQTDFIPFWDLVKSGGPVLVAFVVAFVILTAIIWMAHKYVVKPSQKQTLDIAKCYQEAAEQHKSAAQANERAAQSNERTARANEGTSVANAQTAKNLGKLTEMVLKSAMAGKHAAHRVRRT